MRIESIFFSAKGCLVFSTLFIGDCLSVIEYSGIIESQLEGKQRTQAGLLRAKRE